MRLVKLSHMQGDTKGQEYLLKPGGSYTIGRGKDCEISLSEVILSRHHARIYFKDNQPIVEDLGSSNGTFVNNRQVTSQELLDGDVISWGKCRLAVSFGTYPQQPVTAAPITEASPASATPAVSAVPVTLLAADALVLIAAGKPVRSPGVATFQLDKLQLGYTEAELAQKYQELQDVTKLQAWIAQNPKIYPGLALENGAIGELVICGARFHGAVRFDHLTVAQLAIGETKLPPAAQSLAAVAFYDEVTIADCHFQQATMVTQTTFAQPVMIKNCDFAHDANFANITAPVSLHFVETRFAGEMLLRYAHLPGMTVFSNCQLTGRVDLGRSNFHDLTLRHTVVQGKLICRYGQVTGEASWENSQFLGGADLTGTCFHGKFNAAQTVWRETADFTQVQFKAAVSLEQANFAGKAEFAHLFCAQELNFQDTTFVGRLDLGQAHVAGLVNLSQTDLRGGLTFYQAVVEAIVVEKRQLQGQLLHQQRPPQFEKLQDEYLMLKKSFQARGKFAEEDWAYWQYKRAERKAASQAYLASLRGASAQSALGRLGGFFRGLWGICKNGLATVIVDWGTGYGTHPLRVAAIAAVVIFLFGGIYWGANHYALTATPPQVMIFMEGTEYSGRSALEIAQNSAFMDYVYCSAATFTTMGSGSFHPNQTTWIRYVVILEAILGLFFMALFVGTFTRKIIR